MLKDTAVPMVDFGHYWRLLEDRNPFSWSYWRVSWHPDTGHLVATRANPTDAFNGGMLRLATICERPLVDMVLADWPTAMHERNAVGGDSLDMLRERAQEAERTGTVDDRERVELFFLWECDKPLITLFADGKVNPRSELARAVRARYVGGGFIGEDEFLPKENSILVWSFPEMDFENRGKFSVKATVWL